MILPVIAYGDPVLRKVGIEITKEYPKLDVLIKNMYETMYESSGIGIAAPQVGVAIRLFIIDASPFEDDEDLSEEERTFLSTFNQVFINAKILEETGEEWAFNEGCLSIPDVREDVFRKETIKIEFYDVNFEKHVKEINGILARIIQHEFDHTEGILFTDLLSPIKKRLIKGKLSNISKGKIKVDYRMKFPNAKKKR
ncbi:MAG: peptide deformylase [Flavobacteriaceae bacterium]|jgi:peptide deformylase|uniref:peptide deformylase n=1 Tax=Candidatus Marifrigoribacter sp. Uisw_064 TaxID=3230970 RepID=UPI003AECE674